MPLLAVVGGTVMLVRPFSGMSLGDISTEKLRHKRKKKLTYHQCGENEALHRSIARGKGMKNEIQKEYLIQIPLR